MPQIDWDDIKESEGKGKTFIRLKDGEYIEGVFAGQPYKLFYSFKEKRAYESWEEGRSARYRINFLVINGDEFISRIFETGFTTMSSIKAAIAEYGKDNIFKIKRTGSGKDNTVYHILFKAKLTNCQISDIELVKLLNLGIKKRNGFDESPPTTDDFDDVPPPADEDIPF